MTEIKPVVLKQGVPKAERNGLFGAEERLIEIARAGETLIAIVRFAVPKVPHEEIEDVRWPVVEIAHIEPMFTAKEDTAAEKLLAAAYKARTGLNALPLAELDGSDD